MVRSTGNTTWSTTIPSAGSPSRQNMQKLNEVADRCNAIEECYEFMLAYAGQGIAGEGSDGQIRDFLSRGVKALSGLADVYTSAVKDGFGPPEQSRAFIAVLDRDAK